MKPRLLIAAVCLLTGAAALAQPIPSDDLQLQLTAIRQAYANAKQRAEQAGKNGEPANTMTVNSQYNACAIGTTNKAINYYYSHFFNDETTENYYVPYLITQRYNIAPRNHYEEFLFQEGTGALLFAFIQEESYEGEMLEVRYYWVDNRLVHEIVTGSDRVASAAQAAATAEYLLNAFDSLMPAQ